MWWGSIDWQEALTPTVGLLQIIVRGSIVYLTLFFTLRFVLHREAGTLSMADLLMVTLIADASQNAMAAEYESVTEGLVLAGTIIFWNYAIDWLGYHVPRLRWLVEPPPLMLVKDGKMLKHNMRKELINEDELMTHLREEGIDDVSKVKRAYIEGDGRISVIKD